MSTLQEPLTRLSLARIMELAAEEADDDFPELTEEQVFALATVMAGPDPEPKPRSIEATFRSSQAPTPIQMWEIIRLSEGERGAAFVLNDCTGHELRLLIDVDVFDGRSSAETLSNTLKAGQEALEYVKALLGSSWELETATPRLRSAGTRESDGPIPD